MHTDWLYLGGSRQSNLSIAWTLILCIRVVVPKRAGTLRLTCCQIETDLGLAVEIELFSLWL